MRGRDRDKVVIFGKVEYITRDVDKNIVIGISKRTQVDSMVQVLKLYEGEEVNIFIVPASSSSDKKRSMRR